MRFEALIMHLKTARRSLVREPRYAAVVIVTLALGIAANTVIFSVMNPYLIRPLPFREASRLVQLGHVDTNRQWNMHRFSIRQLEDLGEQSTSFDSLGAYHYSKRNLVTADGAEQIMIGLMSGEMFTVLGVPALAGRAIETADAAGDAERIVVLSHDLWQARFGGGDVVGTSIDLSGVRHRVVGVMPSAFDFPFGEVKLWAPLVADVGPEERGRMHSHLVGRLAEGVTLEGAEAELTGIHARLAETFPDEDGRYAAIAAVPLRRALNFAYDILSVSLSALLATVLLLLLLASVNVASLSLARATTRAQEVAIRASMGATRSRLVAMFFLEGLVLAVLACIVGVFLSSLTLRAVVPLIPVDSLFKSGGFTLDGTVLAFAALISVLTPVVFSLVPALRATRRDLFGALRQSQTASGETMRSRRVLIVVETAIAMVIVTAAALSVRALVAAQEIDVGFEPDRLLAVEIALPAAEYSSADEVEQFFEEAASRLRSLPGALQAGRIDRLPLNHETFVLGFAHPDRVPTTRERLAKAVTTSISNDYFETLGVPVIAGEGFSTVGVGDSAREVVVSEDLARRQWPGASAVGQTLLVGELEELEAVTVVGVVGDVLGEGLKAPEEGQIYVPLGSEPRRRQFIVLASDGEPGRLVTPVREALRELAPTVPAQIRPMTEVVRESLLSWVVPSLFLTVFGVVALLLSTLGIYGVVAYSVACRGREFGIRMALGATASRLVRSVVVEGLKTTGIGVGIGLLVSAGLAMMADRVLGIEVTSVGSFVAVVALFALLGAVASLGPARRAGRINPMVVLRAE